jgi:aldose 1-epimerase
MKEAGMVDRFGSLDGASVRRVRIEGGGLSASIIEWGAAIQDLRLAGHRPPLVLGFETFEHYRNHSPYFGAIVGRFANRIAGGRFTIDGTGHQADTNFLGRHTLHGGAGGTSERLWTLADHGPDFATLRLIDLDGEMGFPGKVDITCTYTLGADATLSVRLEARTDKPTPCSLAHHSYFNLDDGGASPILDHRLEIPADSYLPVDDELIPTGEVAPVEGTAFDFRTARAIRSVDGFCGYDHNWCISRAKAPVRRVARLTGARSGVSLEISSTEPGLQFYAGGGMRRDVPGLEGIRYGDHAGLCLEPQAWPDAPNRPEFPPAILRPGEIYEQVSEYRFSRS